MSETRAGRGGVPLVVEYGRGWVVNPTGPDKRRILMYYEVRKADFFERPPTTNFVRVFVNAYKKLNNLSR